MKRIIKITLIGFLTVIFIGIDICAQEEIQRTPTDDTCVFEAVPDYSPGDISFIAVEKQTYNGLTYGFIRFDISSLPQEAQILDAQLQLKCKDKNISNIEMDIGFAGDNWSEETLTWNSKPPINVWSGHRVTVGSEGSSKNYDVTDYVERWHEGGYPNYGFVLIPVTDESSFTFYSKEKGSTYAPRLFVSYDVPIPPQNFNLISPSDGEENVDLNPVLSWSESEYASKYILNYGTSNTDVQVIANITETTYQLNDLDYDTQYYWIVVAINDYGHKESSQWSFTTNPGEPDINVSPTSLTINEGGQDKGNIISQISNEVGELIKYNSYETEFNSSQLKNIDMLNQTVVVDYGVISIDFSKVFTNRFLSVELLNNDPIKIGSKSLTENEHGYKVLKGDIIGYDNSYAILAFKGQKISGIINFADKLYEIRTFLDNKYILIEKDKSYIPHEQQPLILNSIENEQESDLNEITDDGSVIDVLVAYNNSAASQAGDINTLIQVAVEETNMAYSRSNITPRLNLVYAYNTSYIESGNYSTDLERLTNKSDGFIDEIHDLRDAYGADVCVLFLPTGDYAGIAYLYPGESHAFCVVSHTHATGYFTFAHEIGHIQGCLHNPEESPGTYPFAYGHGYLNTSEGWRTIMSYNNSNCTGGYCQRIQNFSNPSVNYNGSATGTASTHNNARVINETALRVANFRESNNTNNNILNISNVGTGELEIVSLTTNMPDWLSLSGFPSTPFQIQPSGSVSIICSVNWNRLSNQETATVSINSTDPDEGTVTISVTAIPLPDPTYYDVITSSNPASGGNTSGDGSYEEDSQVTVNATPTSGWEFDNWRENGSVVSDSSGYTFTINNNRNLVANFSPIGCEPGWNIVTYTNSTTAFGIVTLYGNPASDGDKVGAFVGGECRGIGTVVANQGVAYVTVVIQGEQVETVGFKIFDVSECQEYSTSYITQTNPGGSIGNPNYLPLQFPSSDVTQTINLDAGWNLISLYVHPNDCSPAIIFDLIISQLIQVKNIDKSYDPNVPDFLNTLNCLEDGDAYYVKVSSDVTVNVTGSLIDYQNTPISLAGGWNYLGYICQTPQNVTNALSSIMDKIEQVKNLKQSYDPSMPDFLNTLTSLDPGKGYMIKLFSSAILIYPSPSTLAKISSSKKSITYKNWVPKIYTNSSTLYLEIDQEYEGIKEGGIVGAFFNGECRGIAEVVENDEKYYSTLIAQGEKQGEDIQLRLIIKNKNLELTSDNVIRTNPGESKRENVSFYKSLFANNISDEIPKSTELYQSYPNPFNPSTTISFGLAEDSEVELSIYNINGELVKQIENNHLNSGIYRYTWDGTNEYNTQVSSGIYLIRLRAKNNVFHQKIILIK